MCVCMEGALVSTSVFVLLWNNLCIPKMHLSLLCLSLCALYLVPLSLSVSRYCTSVGAFLPPNPSRPELSGSLNLNRAAKALRRPAARPKRSASTFQCSAFLRAISSWWRNVLLVSKTALGASTISPATTIVPCGF